jgi:hypothetical protein
MLAVRQAGVMGREVAHVHLALLLMEIETIHINGAHARPSGCFETFLAIFEHDTPAWRYSQ